MEKTEKSSKKKITTKIVKKKKVVSSSKNNDKIKNPQKSNDKDSGLLIDSGLHQNDILEGHSGNKFLRVGKLVGVIGIIFALFLLIYSLLLIFAEKIETIATFPGIFDKSVYNTVVNFNNEVTTINILDGNGNNINGIYVPINSPLNEGGQKGEFGTGKTVYYFHGNAGPMELFYHEIKYINDLGYNVMAYDYPGYGQSGGFPDKRNVDNFSDKFFKYIQKEKGLKNEDLILWGYSVGTAVAVDFASKNDFDKIVLMAPFSSRYDFARDKIGFVLQKFLLLEDSYITKDLVAKFKNPVLIIHGNEDKVIPFSQGKLVYYSYTGKKYFIELDKFGHSGIIYRYGNSLKNIFKNFIDFGNFEFEENYFLGNEEKQELEEENERIEFENSIDLFTDSSREKFVTSTIPFNDMHYVPEDLVEIGSEYIYDSKGGSQVLRTEAKLALDNLGKAFYDEFGKKIIIVSAYRSYSYQVTIKSSGCSDALCAKPGYSEHQTGLVVDISEASSEWNWNNNPTLFKYYIWLTKNAHKYGWHNTYQKGLEIDGYEIEPWHWRYLGVELATYLYENEMTIAEYYRLKNPVITLDTSINSQYIQERKKEEEDNNKG